jgi:hypothetical protein
LAISAIGGLGFLIFDEINKTITIIGISWNFIIIGENLKPYHA